MAGSFTTDFETKLMNWFFTAGAQPETDPVNWWMSLVQTAAPTEATVDPTVNEANYTGYARVDITGATAVTTWTVAVSGNGMRATNDGDINFPQNTGASQTILGALVTDVGTLINGDVIWYDDTINVAVGTNETPTVPAGQAQFDIDV